MKNTPTTSDLIGKTIAVRKLSYELKYEVKKTSEFNGVNLVEGTVLEVTESCPFNVGDDYFITDTELKSAKYLVISASK